MIPHLVSLRGLSRISVFFFEPTVNRKHYSYFEPKRSSAYHGVASAVVSEAFVNVCAANYADGKVAWGE